MTGEFSTGWLSLREPADAAARAADLVDLIALPGDAVVIRDLGCGTGSMMRWLAPRLAAGQQHWILQDRDPALLAYAAAHAPDGVTVETVQQDISELSGQDLSGADLVTCSALLDLFTSDEVARLADLCVSTGTPALFTLSVAGEVTLDPPHPLDAEVMTAFNDHQRRREGDRWLLGPEAVGAAAVAFANAGITVTTRPAPWVLGPEQAPLIVEWLEGWVAAAAEQRPDLQLDGYLAARSASAGAGELRVTVGHQDLFAQKD